MYVSLICTVKNEADNIEALIQSMLAQGRLPDEIVINDCGSTDATVALIEAAIADGAPIRLVHGGWNIPSGRNNAIRHAHGPIIAATDAGLQLDPHWLERIVAPLECGAADLVAGFYEAAPQSLLELAIGATNYPTAAEVDPATFLAAGQSVAVLKQAWEAVGGYPEWADHCEDLIFDRAVAQAGFRTTAVLDAVVHFRPRSSLRAVARQYFFYARGDGVANLWPRRHAIRYASYAALLVLGRVARQRPAVAGLIPLGLWVHTRKPYRRLWPQTRDLSIIKKTALLSLPPLIRLVGDLAKMVGYPVGVWRRWRRTSAL